MPAKRKRVASVQPRDVAPVEQEEKFKSVAALNDEQKFLIQAIHKNDVIVVNAIAGAGKTHTSTGMAAWYLNQNLVDKVIISRPVVATEEIGFLKGSLDEKLDPYVTPIFTELGKFLNVKAAINKGKLLVLPVAFMRGWNFHNSFVLIDESQNLSLLQIKLIISRLCENSKIIFCGDETQSDLVGKKKNDFAIFFDKCKILAKDPENKVAVVTLTQSVRHPLVEKFLSII